jgi:hypothetical protein
MRAFGTAAVFGPGTSMSTIVETIERLVAERRGARVIDRRPRQGA